MAVRESYVEETGRVNECRGFALRELPMAGVT